MTYRACANADGTEKFPLMSIGRACRPRPFREKYGHELGFDYYFNKAWMNRESFFAGLKRFDLDATPGRKAALLIDNCSARGTAQTLPDLQHIEIIFLPQNPLPAPPNFSRTRLPGQCAVHRSRCLQNRPANGYELDARHLAGDERRNYL